MPGPLGTVITGEEEMITIHLSAWENAVAVAVAGIVVALAAIGAVTAASKLIDWRADRFLRRLPEIPLHKRKEHR
jgi:hypothetical protein